MFNVKVEHQVCKQGQPTGLGLMFEITAPQAPVVDNPEPRKSKAMIFVVDRSGSMAGTPLEMVKQTIIETLPRLDANDYLGVVVFDDEAEVIIPLKKVVRHDLDKVANRVHNICDGGSTNIELGYRLAIEEARKVAAGVEINVIMLSDGHANAGLIDPVALGQIAATATEHFVTTSTIGIGRGYDENVLDALAGQGNGNHIAAIEYAEVLNGLQAEIDALLAKTMVDVQIEVMVGPNFCGPKMKIRAGRRMKKWEKIHHGYIRSTVGDLASGEERNVVFDVTLDPHEMAYLGEHSALKVQYTWTDPFTGERRGKIRDFNVQLVAAENWVEPERDADIVAELKAVRLAEIQEQAMELYMQGREQAADALLEKAGIELGEFIANAKLSGRSSARMYKHVSDLTSFAAMDDINIKRKRLREAQNRNNRDRRDFRDNN